MSLSINMNTPPNKNKFMFDINNFDTPNEPEIQHIDVEAEVEPPPPMFSADELEATKAIAHSEGFSEGLAQAKEEHEQYVSDVLKNISENFSSLFAAEIYRERQYEEEALKLSLEIIELLAPSLNTRLGTEALKSALSDVLKRQSEQSEIRIEVDPTSTADIDQYIEDIWPDPDSAPRYKVVANSELDKGACQINWKDGGMIREPKKTAEDIKNAIETLLVEQVISNPNTPLTQEENNAINKIEASDSLETSPPDGSVDNADGEDQND